MYYAHEESQNKKPTHPMCTVLPSFATGYEVAEMCEEYLIKRNLDPVLAKQNGWYPSKDAGDTYLRIVIPARTHVAGHVYWQARDVTGKAFLRYQSPKGPRHEALVRVMPYEAWQCPGVVICEGPMDALAAAQEGYYGFALMGMTPSKDTMMHLALLLIGTPQERTLICLDRGELANSTKVSLFLSTQGVCTAVAELPEKDLAQCQPSLRRKFLSQSFRNLF